MARPVDLRSDTVTQPTAAMREAMAVAEVGDDGYGEDPTVTRLQGLFAERVGKEASLFVPSGTMGNQIALRLLGKPGTAVLAGRRQHVVIYEQGGAATNTQSMLFPIDDTDGTLDPSVVREAIEAVDHHWLPVSAVFVENPHMPAGGVPWELERLADVAAAGVPVHLDGARLFNAEVATGVSAAEYAAHATTVMCCLSKGLGAPIGSMLAGPADLIAQATIERKRLGGAMRQAGVVAAAGIVALTSMVERLADDHCRARVLADAVAARWPEAGFDPASVVTNCVVFAHPDPAKLLEHLDAHGVRAGTIAPGIVRLMTHLDVDDSDLRIAEAADRGRTLTMALFDEIPARALAVFAHPDDPEVACAGTLARWSAKGAKVHLVIVSAGDKGTTDPKAGAKTLTMARAKEAAAAANVMRLSGPELLGIPDGELENTDALREQLVTIIRRTKPEVVVSPDPTAVFFGDNYVNHHDHRALGWAMLDACAPMSSGPLYFPNAGPPHQVTTLLLAGTLEPDTWVEIAQELDTKVAAISCHRSQLGDGDGEMIASFVKARAEQAAAAAGFTAVNYAEGFRRVTLGG